MKLMLVHNYYRSNQPSGENTCFELERDLLRRQGHLVECFTRSSDALAGAGLAGTLRGAAATPWNFFSNASASRIARSFKPDLAHVHNVFPLISPGIFSTLRKHAPVVLTLHNYRLFCAAAIPLRGGHTCTECLDRRSVLPALKYGCYRNSRLATAPLAACIALHRRLGTWQRDVDAFIALTEFQRDTMVAAGLPAHKVHVKPNGLAGCPDVIPWDERGRHAVFVGRLSEEKGVETLVRAWNLWGEAAPELRIVGEGPQRAGLQALASTPRVRFLGALPNARARDEIARARLLVLPSICFEGFPMALCEAGALGTPAAVSHLGPLPGIVGPGTSGFTFRAGDAQDLLATVRAHWDRPAALQRLGEQARFAFETLHTEEANYRRLMQVYAAAIDTARHDRA